MLASPAALMPMTAHRGLSERVGAAYGMRRGSVVVMSVTAPPDYAEHLSARLAQRGILMLDAPVSGGEAKAQAGHMTVAIVLDAGERVTMPLPLSAAVYQMFLMAAAAGQGREDDSAVIKIFPGVDLPRS